MWGVEKLWRAEEEKIVLDLPSVSINNRQTHILRRVPAENTRQKHSANTYFASVFNRHSAK